MPKFAKFCPSCSGRCKSYLDSSFVGSTGVQPASQVSYMGEYLSQTVFTGLQEPTLMLAPEVDDCFLLVSVLTHVIFIQGFIQLVIALLHDVRWSACHASRDQVRLLKVLNKGHN